MLVQLSLSRLLSGMMGLRHHDTVTGGTTYGWFTVYRATVPPDGVPGFHQRDPRRVSAAGPALRGRVPSAYGGVAPRWATPDCTPVYRVPELPPTDTRGSVIVYSRLCQDLLAPGGPGAPVQHGAEQSQSVDSCPPARVTGGAARPRRCSC